MTPQAIAPEMRASRPIATSSGPKPSSRVRASGSCDRPAITRSGAPAAPRASDSSSPRSRTNTVSVESRISAAGRAALSSVVPAVMRVSRSRAGRRRTASLSYRTAAPSATSRKPGSAESVRATAGESAGGAALSVVTITPAKRPVPAWASTRAATVAASSTRCCSARRATVRSEPSSTATRATLVASPPTTWARVS